MIVDVNVLSNSIKASKEGEKDACSYLEFFWIV